MKRDAQRAMRICVHLQVMLFISSVLLMSAWGASKEHYRRSHRRHRRLNDNGAAKCGAMLAGDSRQRGTGIAVQAAHEAAKANDEMTAAVLAASREIKAQYAEKAASAAKAAEVATWGKQQIVEQLEFEVREAQIIAQEEIQTLSGAESNMQMAFTASQQAQQELKMLREVLKLARQNFELAELVAQAGQQSLAEKTSVVEAAKSHVGALKWQLEQARSDLEKTKKATDKAACAAREAQERIERQRRMSLHRRLRRKRVSRSDSGSGRRA